MILSDCVGVEFVALREQHYTAVRRLRMAVFYFVPVYVAYVRDRAEKCSPNMYKL